MLAGDIFPAVREDARRSEIFDRICLREHTIPSIYTCIENTKWLEPGVRILKELLPENGKGSISQQFRALHNRQANMKVQTSEFTSEDRTSPSGDAFWLSHRQLFLFALRHFPEMDGQSPRKDAPKQNTPSSGIQQRWWHRISSLASECGYQGLRRKYRDRQAADAKTVEDCVRSILPTKYYQIEPNRMRRIIQLNCYLMRDVPYAERMKVAPELTSDDDCGSDFTDRYGRPHDHSFQADQESLFIDYIYSASYNTTAKRYLTSFAVKRDIFHSFFGSEEDDLDRQPRFEVPRDTISKGENKSEVMGDVDHIDRDEGANDSIMSPESAEIQLPSQRHLTPENSVDMKEEDGGPLRPSEQQPPMYVFGQQNHDGAVTLAEASRLLSKPRIGKGKPTFTVLSPTGGNKFHKRQADALDKNSMIAALQLPSNSHFVARDNGKRLKMTAPTAIIEAARSQQLQTVLKAGNSNVQELIRRFEDCNDSEEEL